MKGEAMVQMTGFLGFWQQYVLTYFAPVLQMALWVVQIVVLIAAVRIFKRFVDFKTRATKDSTDAPVEQPVIRIDEFVE